MCIIMGLRLSQGCVRREELEGLSQSFSSKCIRSGLVLHISHIWAILWSLLVKNVNTDGWIPKINELTSLTDQPEAFDG